MSVIWRKEKRKELRFKKKERIIHSVRTENIQSISNFTKTLNTYFHLWKKLQTLRHSLRNTSRTEVIHCPLPSWEWNSSSPWSLYFPVCKASFQPCPFPWSSRQPVDKGSADPVCSTMEMNWWRSNQRHCRRGGAGCRKKTSMLQSLLLLLSRFSCVRPCATPQTAAHQAPPSLGFSRQEHWSGLPFPSPMSESESEVP